MRAMLALVKAMRNERLMISQLVRIAMAQYGATGANWEILQSTNLTDEQLAELQGRIGRQWISSEARKMLWQWNE